MTDPKWLEEARRHIGTREIKGSKHEPKILQWWRLIKRGGIKTDEVPWCAAFVGGCLESVGLVSSRFESAKSYLKWGKPLLNPALGCIVVFERDGGGGHVGFVVGRDKAGNLMVLGGNQGDAVNIRPFSVARVSGYRWPVQIAAADGGPLPLLASDGRVSVNEA